jgi:SAM-dependent methyltransferase
MDPASVNDRTFVKAFYEGLYSGSIKPSVSIPLGFSHLVSLGYRENILSRLWDFPWDLAHPCGCPVNHLQPKPQARILNLGSGVGIDAFYFLAAFSKYCVAAIVNLDIAFPALAISRQWAKTFLHEHKSKGSQVFWILSDACHLPFKDKTFDTVLMNGVFNICREKEKLLCEISRILEPEGSLILADLLVCRVLPPEITSDPHGLVWCISGAVTFEELTKLANASALTPPLLHEKHAIDDLFYRAVCSFRKICS